MRTRLSPVLWLLVPLYLASCSAPPDARELRQHLAATVQLGWSGLAIESVRILQRREVGGDWQADVSYLLRLTNDRDALPAEERARIVRYLPMCEEVLRRKGDHCMLRESVIFTRSDYGWMPRDLVVGRPDMLPRVAAGRRDADR